MSNTGETSAETENEDDPVDDIDAAIHAMEADA